MLGGGTVTVKFMPLLKSPPTITTTSPVVTPEGTLTTMLVALQFVGVATVPLNVTALAPIVVPKFAPLIVTVVPAEPDGGRTPVTSGGVSTTVVNVHATSPARGLPAASSTPASPPAMIAVYVARWANAVAGVKVAVHVGAS